MSWRDLLSHRTLDVSSHFIHPTLTQCKNTSSISPFPWIINSRHLRHPLLGMTCELILTFVPISCVASLNLHFVLVFLNFKPLNYRVYIQTPIYRYLHPCVSLVNTMFCKFHTPLHLLVNMPFQFNHQQGKYKHVQSLLLLFAQVLTSCKILYHSSACHKWIFLLQVSL